MRILILSGNPKKEGLCASVEAAAELGAKEAGALTERVSVAGCTSCHVCSDGWGICRTEHVCAFGDEGGFSQVQEKVGQADALIIVTPVYWQETAEGLKSFMDRLRRCEFGEGKLAGKPVLLIASAGGSGNGLLACLEQLERFCRHLDGEVYDMISVNRWNSDYKREAARSAAAALASGREHGSTVGLK